MKLEKKPSTSLGGTKFPSKHSFGKQPSFDNGTPYLKVNASLKKRDSKRINKDDQYVHAKLLEWYNDIKSI